ncbi:MAG: alkaline phosphatase family protein, partial [Streptosporangiaceae bacterium]
ISWKFYVQHYDPRQESRAHPRSNLGAQTARVPLLGYPRFIKNRQLRSHIVDLDQYYRDLRSGTLPAVAFIASSPGSNERSASTIPAGQRLVRTLITQLMLSRSWSSSAFMWSYDGSGGFYDHVVPPRAGSAQLGFRVPALLVSPYARRGKVSHTVLDYASALAFIEHNWHLAPLTQMDASAHGLVGAFNFAAGPQPPDIIATPLSQGGIKEPLIRKPPVRAVYEIYGGALVLALMLMAGAIAFSARSARRVSGASR